MVVITGSTRSGRQPAQCHCGVRVTARRAERLLSNCCMVRMQLSLSQRRRSKEAGAEAAGEWHCKMENLLCVRETE